ncbi:MAG: bifunctional phosphoribosylaminoimidazolecarboxamide formyltransferase/IMP cyclohydrolase [Candidatus Latescibacteria bacterium]|nr:bifunctional phosphoribosylaminoimidazolecarboxamide formyltransferase/IMP cyclohydrolase [Candidatus Latescibacterota bacterium]
MTNSAEPVPVQRALLSVSDKTDLVEFAKGLADLGIEILSTGGTRSVLEEAGLTVIDVSDYTGSGEMMDGRVKTLHPKLHAGLLARRDHEGDMAELKELGWDTVDLVAVNLYPFEEKAIEGRLGINEATAFIDIGGPTMLRAAAKNHKGVVVVPDPSFYAGVLEALREGDEVAVPLALSRRLASEVFRRTALYDGAVSSYLQELIGKEEEGEEAGGEEGTPFGTILLPRLERVEVLRYGENPHQKAAFYRDPFRQGPNLADAEQLGGKQLSFNNIIDLESAMGIPLDFDDPACALIKHTNPCGAGTGGDLIEAYENALATDPISAFGGLAGFNRPVDKSLAEKLVERFWEAIIAPGFSEDALEVLRAKKNLRIMRYDENSGRDLTGAFDYKRVYGGLLVQEVDSGRVPMKEAKVVTKRQPTGEELAALEFGWRVVKWVKSNAIVYAAADRTLGVGAGQMSRVDSAQLAVKKAETAGLSLEGCAMASDAFFPFRDAVDAAAEAGVMAIVEPGGSIRDEEVIGAADEQDIAMLFTGMRHFRH